MEPGKLLDIARLPFHFASSSPSCTPKEQVETGFMWHSCTRVEQKTYSIISLLIFFGFGIPQYAFLAEKPAHEPFELHLRRAKLTLEAGARAGGKICARIPHRKP